MRHRQLAITVLAASMTASATASASPDQPMARPGADSGTDLHAFAKGFDGAAAVQ
jgi:hypothetical protein